MSGERTEQATPRKLQQLRSQGQVARSPELGPSIGLLAGSVIIQMIVGGAATRLTGLMTADLGQVATTGRVADVDTAWMAQVIGLAGQTWLLSVAPLLLALPLIGIGVGFAQGVAFSIKPMLRFSNLNPMNGAKRMFSMQALMTLGRSLLKVILVGVFTWKGLNETLQQLPTVDGSLDPRVLATFIAQAMMNVSLPAAEVLLVVAVADFAYQRWTFGRNARMSKQDVKEEHKQSEGDPMVKGQIRARQRKMAMAKRGLKDVPKATVVVTNPTHIAVALQYERGMASPRVVAMGADLLAERIKKIARESGVPCIENVPLARGLYRSVEVGDEIPVELYQAVAEILAYVFSLKARRRQRAAA